MPAGEHDSTCKPVAGEFLSEKFKKYKLIPERLLRFKDVYSYITAPNGKNRYPTCPKCHTVIKGYNRELLCYEHIGECKLFNKDNCIFKNFLKDKLNDTITVNTSLCNEINDMSSDEESK